MPCKTKILRYRDRWFVVQRLTFDSMYRVLDLEPGWLHRGEGEKRERERSSPWTRILQTHVRKIRKINDNVSNLLFLFLSFFSFSFFLSHCLSSTWFADRFVIFTSVTLNVKRGGTGRDRNCPDFFSLRTYGYMNHSSGARKTR